MSHNLPPGCTQAHIDALSESEEDERDREEADFESQIAQRPCNDTKSGFYILCDRLECQRDRKCYAEKS